MSANAQILRHAGAAGQRQRQLKIATMGSEDEALLGPPSTSSSSRSFSSTGQARFHALVSALYLELAAGGGYAVGIYAPHLKDHFGLTQRQIQLLATLANVGMWFALPCGAVYDRFGPRPCIAIGVFVTCAGYLILYGSLLGKLPESFAVLAVGAFLTGFGPSGWWDASAIPMASKTFKQDRGLVIGLLKAFYGISASVVTVAYQSFFRPDVPSFLLALACALPALGAVCMAGATDVDPASPERGLSRRERGKILNVGYGLLVVFATYAAVASQVQSERSSPGLGWGLFALMLTFLAMLPWGGAKGSRGAADVALEDAAAGGHRSPRVRRRELDVRDASFEAVLKDHRFWAVFAVSFVVFGSGTSLRYTHNSLLTHTHTYRTHTPHTTHTHHTPHTHTPHTPHTHTHTHTPDRLPKHT